MDNALKFLENTDQFFPDKIHTILTDHGLQFSDRALSKALKTNQIHPFDQRCEAS